jgi:hypothetical protein
VLPQALAAQAAPRAAQLQALGARVQATLKADAQARLVLIGDVTVPGMIDLTQKTLPKDAKLPTERVLMSPTLLRELERSTIQFPAVKPGEGPAQVLQLKP